MASLAERVDGFGLTPEDVLARAELAASALAVRAIVFKLPTEKSARSSSVELLQGSDALAQAAALDRRQPILGPPRARARHRDPGARAPQARPHGRGRQGMGAEEVVATMQREDRVIGAAVLRRRRVPRRFRERWLVRPSLAAGAFGVAALGRSVPRAALRIVRDEARDVCPSAKGDASVDASNDASSRATSTKDPKDEPCVLDTAYGVFVAAAGERCVVPEGPGNGVGQPRRNRSEALRGSIGQALANMAGKSR